MTKSNDSESSETIKQFIANDLLQLKANRLLPKLLWPLDDTEDALVQQNCVASLLNAIVSFKEGRKYFDGIPMFDTLTANALGNSFIEKNTFENLIAVMAKLSVAACHRHDFRKNGKMTIFVTKTNYFCIFLSFAFRRTIGLAAESRVRR